MTDRQKGTIKIFKSDKGYGFINFDDERRGDIFFHISNTQIPIEDLVPGKAVSFQVIDTARGLAAANVALL